MTDKELLELAENAERDMHWQRIENGAMQIAAAACTQSAPIMPSGIKDLAVLAIQIARAIVQEIDRLNMTEAGLVDELGRRKK